MGANGSFVNGTTSTEESHRWKTVAITESGIKIIEMKNPKSSLKLPEESHSPNSIYAVFNKGGNGLKGIAKYGPDGKSCLRFIQQTIMDWGYIIMLGKTVIRWKRNLLLKV